MTAGHRPRWAVLCALGIGVVLVGALSLRFGVRPLAWDSAVQALVGFDPGDPDHIAVRTLRVPRTIAAILAGAALGLAGALMQALTRNPLADPGLLGVNGGAAMGVVVAIWGFGVTGQAMLVAPALLGAGLAAVLVLSLGGGATGRAGDSARLVLAGAAVGALFLALTWAILIVSRESLDVYRFWVLGGFGQVDMAQLSALWPFYGLAALFAALAALSLNPLLLGEDTARGLGVRVGLVRLVTLLAVIALCGTTVALAGPIAFVGLIVPHLARPLAGPDIRWLAALSAAMGALLALSADIAGRLVQPGREIEAGAMIALIGGPALIVLVRQRRAAPI